MVLVLLERKQTSGESPYAMVKQAGDSALGIRTQCFAADKAGIGRNARPPKGRLQYCANVAMKINTKMGGVNVKLLDDPKQVGGGRQWGRALLGVLSVSVSVCL
jgi:eukaryotic translation initiation factor 2C